MRVIEIPRRKWSQQLDEFSRTHDGRLVSLDIQMANSIGAQFQFREMPLMGITVEPAGRGMISIAVEEAAGDHLTHMIHSPTRVFLEKTKAGAKTALKINSADGTKAVLRFNASRVPEIPDAAVRH